MSGQVGLPPHGAWRKWNDLGLGANDVVAARFQVEERVHWIDVELVDGVSVVGYFPQFYPHVHIRGRRGKVPAALVIRQTDMLMVSTDEDIDA